MSRDADIARAVAELRRGGLVAFPTETVYGLGADAADPAAVARIFAAKGRPADRPLSVHLGPSADPGRWGAWGATAQAVADAFLPGPLTIIVPRAAHVPDIVTAGGPTVGIRVPSHPLCIAFLDAFGGGVAATSANRSGHISPTSADHVRANLGDAVDFVLDGGSCPVGVESTVLLLGPEPRVLRRGAVAVESLQEVLGRQVATPSPARGTHYATRTPLRVMPAAAVTEVAAALGPRCAALAPHDPGHGARWIPAPVAAEEFARRLFALLRDLDAAGVDAIAVAAVPRGGLWDSVAERLDAAAAASGGTWPASG